MDFLKDLNLPLAERSAWDKYMRTLSGMDQKSNSLPEKLAKLILDQHQSANLVLTEQIEPKIASLDDMTSMQLASLRGCISIALVAQSLSIHGTSRGLDMHKLLYVQVDEATKDYQARKLVKSADPETFLRMIQFPGRQPLDLSVHFNNLCAWVFRDHDNGLMGRLPTYVDLFLKSFPRTEGIDEIQEALEASFTDNARKTWEAIKAEQEAAKQKQLIGRTSTPRRTAAAPRGRTAPVSPRNK